MKNKKLEYKITAVLQAKNQDYFIIFQDLILFKEIETKEDLEKLKFLANHKVFEWMWGTDYKWMYNVEVWERKHDYNELGMNWNNIKEII